MGWMVRGSKPGGGKIFRTRPDRPWGPPSLLYWVRGLFPGGKVAGRDADHPPPSSAEVKERAELYFYSTSGPSRPVIGWTLPFFPFSLYSAQMSTFWFKFFCIRGQIVNKQQNFIYRGNFYTGVVFLSYRFWDRYYCNHFKLTLHL